MESKDSVVWSTLKWLMIGILFLLIPGSMLGMLELIRMVFSLARYAN